MHCTWRIIPISTAERVALVTGGSRGIGRAIALRLAEAGHPVAVNYQTSAEAAAKVVEEIEQGGGRAIAVQADVSRGTEVERLFSEVTTGLGSVSILVNNAAIVRNVLLMRMSEAEWDGVIENDLRSVFLCTKAAMRGMIRARWGRIITLSSVVGLQGNAGQAAYAAAKAGVLGFTRSVAREVASRSVTVNAIAPGFITTDMTAGLSDDLQHTILKSIPMERLGSPDDVAEAALFLSSESASYITGQVLTVDGGMVMG